MLHHAQGLGWEDFSSWVLEHWSWHDPCTPVELGPPHMGLSPGLSQLAARDSRTEFSKTLGRSLKAALANSGHHSYHILLVKSAEVTWIQGQGSGFCLSVEVK